MGVIMWISRYVMTGVIVSLILDLLNRNNPNPDQRFSNKERIVILFIWPIAVATFVYHFFNASNRE